MNLLIRIKGVVQRKIEVEGSDLVVVLVLADQRAVVSGPGKGRDGGSEGGREGGREVRGPVIGKAISPASRQDNGDTKRTEEEAGRDEGGEGRDRVMA
jgi:hypothetical protein